MSCLGRKIIEIFKFKWILKANDIAEKSIIINPFFFFLGTYNVRMFAFKDHIHTENHIYLTRNGSAALENRLHEIELQRINQYGK